MATSLTNPLTYFRIALMPALALIHISEPT